jgi:hypothetical protein
VFGAGADASAHADAGSAASARAVAARAAGARHGPEPAEVTAAAAGAMLEATLLTRARAWAAAVTPGADAPLVDPGGLLAAARTVFDAGGGPLLLASTEAPRLSPAHARMALDDLGDGADASFGPGMDGGWYLVALARPHDALLALLDEAIDGPDVMGRALAVAAEAGLDVGLLRMERLLRGPGDALALGADPLTPADVRSALRRTG